MTAELFITFILLFVTHYIADFRLQTNWMAMNKSKWLDDIRTLFTPKDELLPSGVLALFLHVLVYSACFIWLGLVFAGITFVTHLVTDAITSLIGRRYWFVSAKDDTLVFDDLKRSLFFRTIGFDQLVHTITLLGTLYLLG